MSGWKLRILVLAGSLAVLAFVTSIGAQEAVRGVTKPASVDIVDLQQLARTDVDPSLVAIVRDAVRSPEMMSYVMERLKVRHIF
jgi:hypothetical protein